MAGVMDPVAPAGAGSDILRPVPPAGSGDMPPPWTPPNSKSEEAPWFPVGYGGTGGGSGGGGSRPSGGGMGSMGMPSYQSAMQAYLQQQGKVDSIFGQSLGPDSGRFGLLGKVLSQMLTNPQGFDEKTRRGHLTRLAEREAGTRTDQNRRLGRMMQGGGRGNAAVATALQEQLRGESGARLSSAELDFETQDQIMRQQALFEALRGGVGVSGIQAGLVGQHGAIAGASNVPVQGGQGAGGGAGGPGGLPTTFGDIKNRLPGETLAEQIRREAAARAAAQAAGQQSGGGFTPGNPSQAFGW